MPYQTTQFTLYRSFDAGQQPDSTAGGLSLDEHDTLSFRVLENVRPMIETMPLEKAADAYARMMMKGLGHAIGDN